MLQNGALVAFLLPVVFTVFVVGSTALIYLMIKLATLCWRVVR